jgi:hypothetical protein
MFSLLRLNFTQASAMYIYTLFSAFVATAVAAPFIQRPAATTGESKTWQPTTGTKTTCDTKSMDAVGGAQLSTAINNACAAMMPGCAYPDRLPQNTFCTATVDYPIDGPMHSTQYLYSSQSLYSSQKGGVLRCKFRRYLQ